MNFQRPRNDGHSPRPSMDRSMIEAAGGLIVTFTRDPSDNLLHRPRTYEDAAALFKLRSG